MSRRSPAAGATISLFPFLAVLLCTMGALLVLLVIFSRRARESDKAAALAAEQARVEEQELARDELRWRLEQLHGVQARTAEDLARERMRLAGVEEDSRKLADELAALERTAQALASAAPAADAAGSLTDAERRLEAAKASLAETRTTGATKPPAYAVIPYEGGNGTHRRPLYVECCIDGVFIQPEGIRLGPADFEGPPGPGNPLASALRAAREHLARNPGESGDPATQPYPLLLVRPSGVMAYYAAREALVSWGSEFGYQFVDEDWQLTYPPADPALAAVEQRAIDESRRRIEWLAQVRPARPARPTQQYRASITRGGVEAEGGPTVLGDQSRFDWTEEQVGAGGRRAGAGGSGSGDAAGGDVVLGAGGGKGGGGSGRGGGGTAGGRAVPGSQPGHAVPGGTADDRYAGPSRFYAGQPPAGSASDGEGGGGPGGSQAVGAATGSVAGPGGAGRRGQQDGPSADGTAGGSDLAAAAGDRSGSGGSPAAGGGAGGPSGGAPGSSAASAAAGGGGSSGGPALPGMMQGGGATGATGGGSAAASLAGARGSNWASLATADRPIPLTRPIRVECAANEFRVFDDGAARVETRIPIGTRTADSVDPLVQAVHARVAGWGLAGERMYWRPELVLSETVDGRARREDLERLLADSGLDTRRGTDDTEVRFLPPITRTSAVLQRR